MHMVMLSSCFIVAYVSYNVGLGLGLVLSDSGSVITSAASRMINANGVSAIFNHPWTDEVVIDTTRLPHFVIHIGPHKTATTYLQGTLCVKSADAILDMDDYYYLGTSLRSFRRRDKLAFDLRSIFNHAPYHRPSSSPPALDEDFAALLRKMRSKNQSGILIHEALHKIRPEYVQVLSENLKEYWNVIVVEGYRPLHEWLVSRFNQFTRDEYTGSMWPDGTGRGGRGELGFPPNLRFGLTTNTRFDHFTYPFLLRNTSIFETSLEVWSKYFDVRLVDIPNLPPRLDGEDPLLMHFMCEIVPGAYNLCLNAPDLANEANVDMSSSQYGRAYESLTSSSWHMHLIDRRLNRKLVRDTIKNYHEVRLNGTELPMLCPPRSEMDVLWQWTLQTDERLFGNTYHHDQKSSSSRREALWASFEKSAQRNKFCSVDVSVLLQKNWKPLFSLLDKIARGEFDAPDTKSTPKIRGEGERQG
ncbi:hypothetical protein ACHAW5_008020 [Stephanodiscus triporus]|uniref:Uncharacterized protein n=1 Tax=Stephanodiscus triporus TaxID=2934178 RepID=A0ABD3NM44_9STRA